MTFHILGKQQKFEYGLHSCTTYNVATVMLCFILNFAHVTPLCILISGLANIFCIKGDVQVIKKKHLYLHSLMQHLCEDAADVLSRLQD